MLVRLKNDRFFNTSQICSISPASDWHDFIPDSNMQNDKYIVMFAGLNESGMFIDKEELGRIKRAMYMDRHDNEPV